MKRLAQQFERLARDEPTALAVADDRGRALSRAQLRDAAAQLAQVLRELGVGASDTVLVLIPNSVEWQITLLAVLQLQAVPATLPTSTDASTITYLIDHVQARAVIIAPNDVDAIAPAVLFGTGHLVDLVLVEPDGGARAERRSGQPPRPHLQPRLEHLMFTSSTTGMPKAVMHTVESLAALNEGFAERFALDQDTPLFMASPLGHSIGAIHGGRLALFVGAPLILQERWNAGAALELMSLHGCSFTAAATPFLIDLLDAHSNAGSPPLPLRTFLCGGAQVPPDLMRRAERQLPATFFTVLWGMTEGGVTTCAPGVSPEKRAGTAGEPLPGLALRILSPEGAELDRGDEGELAMRGPGVFFGYLGDDDLYRASMTNDGFFRTGDLARVDQDGFLTITGRIKDVIIRGGVNIAPAPIEAALAGHPSVREIAVIGAPDPRLGERICAVVVPTGAEPSLEALIEWARTQDLPQRQWPEQLVCIGEMPVTAAGKIRKHQLKDALFEGANAS